MPGRKRKRRAGLPHTSEWAQRKAEKDCREGRHEWVWTSGEHATCLRCGGKVKP